VGGGRDFSKRVGFDRVGSDIGGGEGDDGSEGAWVLVCDAGELGVGNDDEDAYKNIRVNGWRSQKNKEK